MSCFGLPGSSNVIAIAFDSHKRGAANLPEVDFAIKKSQLWISEPITVKDVTDILEKELGGKIHKRQTERKKRKTDRILAVIMYRFPEELSTSR